MSLDDGDEGEFETGVERRIFGASLLREPLHELALRDPLLLAPGDSVTDAMRLMQREHRGCVLITLDGTSATAVIGIFTERDVLLRIVDRGKNPATLALEEAMTPAPESLTANATVAHALNRMSVGGFRHIPVIDESGRPVYVVSVRDIVEFLVAAFPREVLTLPMPGSRPSGQREGA